MKIGKNNLHRPSRPHLVAVFHEEFTEAGSVDHVCVEVRCLWQAVLGVRKVDVMTIFMEDVYSFLGDTIRRYVMLSVKSSTIILCRLFELPCKFAVEAG